MNGEISGEVLVPRSIFSSEAWTGEYFTWGAAYMDLWGLANDRTRTLRVRGNQLIVGVGQLGWSERKLASRWGWSIKKVRRFLQEMEKARKIRLKTSYLGTLITVCGYNINCVKIKAEGHTDCLTEDNTEAHTEEHTEDNTDCLQKGKYIVHVRYKSQKGEGGKDPSGADGVGEEADGVGVEVPSDEEVAGFCRGWPGDMARGIPAGIPEGWWAGWLAMWLSRERFPRDWRRVLTLAFVGDWVRGHPKARVRAEVAGVSEFGDEAGARRQLVAGA